jgi:hypothetical protein
MKTSYYSRSLVQRSLAILVGFLLCSTARADVIIYSTRPPVPLPPLQNLLIFGPAPQEIGTTGFFDIYISTDVGLAALALDLFVESPHNPNPAIRLTDLEILNFASPTTIGSQRWSVINDGTVAADGLSIVDGTALGGFGLASPASIRRRPTTPTLVLAPWHKRIISRG